MSIWEGSGNVTSLDVLRALHKQPASAEALLGELDAAAGADRRYDDSVRQLREEIAAPRPERARKLAELLALTLQASLLIRHAPTAVSEAFVATRLVPDTGRSFGTIPDGLAATALLERVTPGR